MADKNDVMGTIVFGFRSSQTKGGQHTNGPDYGVVTGECELTGIRIELQTRAGFGPHKARELIETLIGLANEEKG